MLAVSNAFNEAFKSDLREVKMRIKVNDVTYTDEDIVSFNYNAGSIVGESFAIGSTYANTIKLTLCKIVEGLKQLDEVIPEMGIVLPSGSTEFVKLGTFIISEEVNPDRNENRTSLECTDKMIMLDDVYESKLTYPAKIRDVALEIANLAGVEVDKVSFSRLMESMIKEPKGYTFRQALGLIAQFEAGYACFDRNGLLAIRQLEDKDYKVTPNEYFQKGLTKLYLIFRPAGIEVKVNGEQEEDKVLSVGNNKGSVIRLENKVMTEQLLNIVYEKIKDINYYPYSLNWRGNPAVEVGDWLFVDDTRGNVFKVPNLSYSMEYKGGLTATSTVETVASNEVRFGYKGILDQVIEHVDNVIKGVDGNNIYYGIEEPPYPKEGDIWFNKNGPDTEIWVYEKVGDPDIFDWVLKISTALDDTIKEKIEDLEQISKDAIAKSDKALKEAEKARDEAKLAREEAFDSSAIAKQAESDALNALAKGDENSTQITNIQGEQKLTNIKVEGNTASIMSLESNADKFSLALGKVQSDVDGISVGGRNYLLKSKDISQSVQVSSNNTSSYPITRELLSEKNITFYRIKRTALDNGSNVFSLYNVIRFSNFSTNYSEMKDVKISFKARAQQDIDFVMNGKEHDGGKTFVDIHGKRIKITKEWQTFSFNIGEFTPENVHSINVVPTNPISYNYIEDLSKFYLDLAEYKIEMGSMSTDWSPAPEDNLSQSEFAIFEANYKGFQQTVNSDIQGLESQQTQMVGQITSTVEKVDNLKFSDRNLAVGTEIPNYWNGSQGTEIANDQTADTNWTYPKNMGFGDFLRYFKVKTTDPFTVSARVKLERKDGQPVVKSDFSTNFKFSTFRITGGGTSWREFASLTSQMIKDGVEEYSVEETFYFQDRDIATDYQNPFIRKWIRYFPREYKLTVTDFMFQNSSYKTPHMLAPEDNASKTEVTQLSNQWAVTAQEVKTIDGIVSKQQASIAVLTSQIDLKVGNDEVISRINMSNEMIRIESKLIHLSGQSYIEDAVITSAMIKDVSADSIITGELNAAKVNIINLNANNIVTGDLRGISLTSIDNQGYFNVRGNKAVLQNTSNNRRVEMDDTGIYVYNVNGTLRGELSQYIVNTGLVGTNTYNVYIGTGGMDGVEGESDGGELRVVRYDSTPGTGAVTDYKYRPVRAEGFVGNYVNVNTPFSAVSHLYLRPRYGEGEVRITGSGSVVAYQNLRARGIFADTFDGNSSTAGEHLYIRPIANGEVRTTRIGTTDRFSDLRTGVVWATSISNRDTEANFYIGTDKEVRVTSRGMGGLGTIYYRDIRAANFITNSQEESKQNIQEYRTSALDVIDTATIYQYRLRSEISEGIDRENIGLVIGAGYQTPDEIVQNGGINQYAMSSLAWKAIQELNQKIKILEERLEHANVA